MKKRILALVLCACMLIGIPQAGATASMLGDADCDGRVTAADVSLVLRYSVKLSSLSEQGMENADVNGNGNPDANDAAMILRYLVGLAELGQTTPKPTASPTPTPVPTSEPTPIPDEELDQQLLKWIKAGTQYHYGYMAEDITRFIQMLPTDDPYRALLYSAAKYMGTSYNSMDCSTFVRKAFRDCGYQSDVYPSGSSNTVIIEFRKQGLLHDVTHIEDRFDTSGWRPGTVLLYVNEYSTGNHVSIYLGNVNGEDLVMESASSNKGVGICALWENASYQLVYYVNPLG